MRDEVLLLVITVLLFAAGAMRVKLAEVKKTPLSAWGKVQAFAFPAALLATVILLKTGIADLVFPVILVGIAEELVFWVLRRRNEKETKKTAKKNPNFP